MTGAESLLRARDLYERGQLVEAARRESDACERDSYDVTAAILRDLADNVERLKNEVSELKKRLGYPEFAR